MVTRMQVKGILDKQNKRATAYAGLRGVIWGKEARCYYAQRPPSLCRVIFFLPPPEDFYTLTTDDVKLLELLDLKELTGASD